MCMHSPQDFKIKGEWTQKHTQYGYDFWCACTSLQLPTLLSRIQACSMH